MDNWANPSLRRRIPKISYRFYQAYTSKADSFQYTLLPPQGMYGRSHSRFYGLVANGKQGDRQCT